MLGYIILAALQFAIAWFGTPELIRILRISVGGDVQIFIQAAIAAVIVWIVGVVGSLVLKDVKMPASSTLAAALVGALIGAAIVVVPAIRDVIPFSAPPFFFPIAGAIIGYMIRR